MLPLPKCCANLPRAEIPPELYEAVALLLSYLMEMDAKAKAKKKR